MTIVVIVNKLRNLIFFVEVYLLFNYHKTEIILTCVTF